MNQRRRRSTTKRRGPVRTTKTVYLRLPQGMVEQIRDAAHQRGWTMNRWMETLLEEVLPTRRNGGSGGNGAG